MDVGLLNAIRDQSAQAIVHAAEAHDDSVAILTAINELVKVTRGVVEPVRGSGYRTMSEGGGHGQY